MATYPTAKARTVLLLLLIAAGAALRVWYASGELHINRFEDERYSLRNVRSLLATWECRPASGYYPSPVFNLPQALAVEGSQRLSLAFDLPALRTYGARGEFGPAAFLITRLYQTLCGVVTLWLAFLVGRRLASPRAGLIAATLLAFMPWMIHASGYNKPDALLVMAVLLSLHAALRALDSARPWPTTRPALRHGAWLWMWAGVCIAVAMSAKITGGLAAVPLAVGALMATDERKTRARHLALLALAGATSALMFVLINPYWRAYVHFLRGLQRDYAGRTDASRWEIPWQVVSMHLEPLVLGPLLGTAALAAFAAASVLLLWRSRGRGEPAALSGQPTQTQLAMLLSYPLLYGLAYSAQTAYFKANNFLPTIPFTVLALACLIDAGLRAAEARWPDRRTVLQVATAAVLLALVVPTGWRYVYNSRVPTTFDVVVAQLNDHLEPAAGQLVFMERWTPPRIPWDGSRGLHAGLSTIAAIDDLSTLPPEVADLAAALVWVHDGRSRTLHPTTVGAWPTSLRWQVQPRPFRYRGPPMEVVLRAGHRQPVIGLDARACGRACLQAPLPDEMTHSAVGTDAVGTDAVGTDAVGTDIVSVFVLLPERLLAAGAAPRLAAGAREEPLHRTSRQRDGVLFVSPRLRLPAALDQLRLVSEQPFFTEGTDDAEGVQVELHRWSPAPEAEPPPPLPD